jgi:hypothetical protein
MPEMLERSTLSQHLLSRRHDWHRTITRRLAQVDAAWLAVLLSYFAVFGGMLLYSDFLPFTFDNNESFAAYLHARNMYEFGIVSSSGLPDESLSNDAAAHPYIYTHAGASPRLFAYVLYVLGARTVELQLAVTAFTVGLLAFWFVYRFLADVSTRLYAVAACLLLLTDYIMFAQWHIGLWHVWKTLLLFGGLYLAHRVADKEQSRPLLMVYAFHVFLFYYETIFNVYVAAALFLYVILATRDYRLAAKFGLAQVAGTLTAAIILLAQLVNHFGWDVVRADIYYTFIGRNFATDPTAFLEEARAFYATHNIAFWLNIPDSSHYRTLSWVLQVLFQDHAVHTPPWSLVVLAFAAAELVRRLRGARASPAPLSSTSKFATVPAAFVLGALSAAAFAVLARYPELAAGLPPGSPVSMSGSWVIVMGGGVLFAAAIVLAPAAFPSARLGPILGASAFVAAVLAFLLVQPALYAGGLEPIWRAALAAFAGYTTAGAVFVSAMLLLAAWYAFGAPIAIARGSLSDRLLFVLAALLCSYVLVYFIFTGYIRNGYFLRYLSLTVFLNNLVLAVGLVAMFDCARGWHAAYAQSMGLRRMAYGGGATVAAFGLVGVLVYWGALQTFLFRKLPPDTISFLPILSTPPFHGSTFTALSYGATPAYFSGNWAYLDADSAIGEGSVKLGPDGYEVKQNLTYAWFADRAVNPAYRRPEYFLTMTYKSLGLAYLTDDRIGRRPRAGDVPLIRAIREGRTSYLHPVEVARDPSPRDRWSIVRLDWDFPPFLRPLDGGEFVGLNTATTGNGTRIHVDYRYAHQEGTPEAGTRVALRVESRCDGLESTASALVPPLPAAPREFELPPSFAGTVSAEVQPATATKTGPVYTSGILRIGSADACPDASPTPR